MLNLSVSQLTRLFRRFKRDNRGNIAVVFALTTLPIIGFVGTAVDFSSANAAKVRLQAALDSTALMLAKYAPGHTVDEVKAQAPIYFNALFNSETATSVSLTTTYTSSTSKITLDGSAEVPTNFMSVLGIDSVTINGSSTTTWGTTRLRVALVLDNTGSMAQDGKMTALKTATKSLLSQLQSAASNDGDVYVSIIPFSKDVNVGSVELQRQLDRLDRLEFGQSDLLRRRRLGRLGRQWLGLGRLGLGRRRRRQQLLGVQPQYLERLHHRPRPVARARKLDLGPGRDRAGRNDKLPLAGRAI